MAVRRLGSRCSWRENRKELRIRPQASGFQSTALPVIPRGRIGPSPQSRIGAREQTGSTSYTKSDSEFSDAEARNLHSGISLILAAILLMLKSSHHPALSSKG